MQQLSEKKHLSSADRCAAAVLDLGLAVSRLVRAQMRRGQPHGLTLPQLRALGFVNADPDCAPSQLAEYLMLGRPAVTRLLDILVKRRLITRRPHPDDRRRLQLALTRAGHATLDAYYARARAIVAERLAPLPERERALVRRVMARVLPLVAPAAPTAPGTPGSRE
ncbi:MAG TPA: MarR family transcriptional regulator [Gemmatimonadaceae bacterium]|nr:MarR family transcriptional regulator [Gemmatimonadaceae bacterium]